MLPLPPFAHRLAFSIAPAVEVIKVEAEMIGDWRRLVNLRRGEIRSRPENLRRYLTRTVEPRLALAAAISPGL
jgi:hypothetical protein